MFTPILRQTSRAYLIEQIKQSKLEGATYQRYISLRDALEIFGQHHGGDCEFMVRNLFDRMEVVDKHTPELKLRQIMCVLRLYANCAMMGRSPFIG